jgi:hypothetical protein
MKVKREALGVHLLSSLPHPLPSSSPPLSFPCSLSYWLLCSVYKYKSVQYQKAVNKV